MAENFENEIINSENPEEVQDIEVSEPETEEAPQESKEEKQPERNEDFDNDAYKKYQRRLANARQEKIRLQELANKLQAENDRLRTFAETSSELASLHYDDSINSRLKIAENIKRQARENGDYDAEIEADKQIARIISEQRENDKYKAQQKVTEEARKRETQYHQNYQPQSDLNLDTQDWLERNSWANPQDEEYDEELFSAASSYAKSLEIKYRKNGQENRIMTKGYFDEIDKYMKENFMNEPLQPSNKVNTAPIKTTVAPVSKVKGSSQRIVLSDTEKEFAKACGMTDAEYIQEKEMELKKLNRSIK